MGSYRLQGEYSLYSEQESKTLEGLEQEKADLHTVKQPLVHQRPPLLSILLLRTCSWGGTKSLQQLDPWR